MARRAGQVAIDAVRTNAALTAPTFVSFSMQIALASSEQEKKGAGYTTPYGGENRPSAVLVAEGDRRKEACDRRPHPARSTHTHSFTKCRSPPQQQPLSQLLHSRRSTASRPPACRLRPSPPRCQLLPPATHHHRREYLVWEEGFGVRFAGTASCSPRSRLARRAPPPRGSLAWRCKAGADDAPADLRTAVELWSLLGLLVVVLRASALPQPL